VDLPQPELPLIKIILGISFIPLYNVNYHHLAIIIYKIAYDAFGPDFVQRARYTTFCG
jgi:hypothetical protein